MEFRDMQPPDNVGPPALPPASAPLVIGPDMLEPAPPPETRMDFERGMGRFPALSILLIAANLAVFIWELSTGALGGEAEIVAAGALERARFLSGEIWRPVTAMFLHASPGHLIGNCVMLYILGMACEHALGFRRTLIVYLAGGLTGAFLSLAMSPGPSVGASGAIFGVMGAVVAFLLRHSGRFYIRDKRIAIVLVIWGAWQIATGFLTPMIDNYAHLGGALGGAICAMILKPGARVGFNAPGVARET